MCGRFALTASAEDLADLFGVEVVDLPEIAPRENIAPTQSIVTVLSDKGARRLSPMRWGFPPPPAASFGPMPNARSETLAQSPVFREAARTRRCLVPASAWYEWTGKPGGKIPWRARARAGGVLAFAAVWAEGPTGPACAVVTCAPNAVMRGYHHRMPVVVAPESYALWLGEAGKGAARLMVPAPEDLLVVERVSPQVNSVRYQGAVETLEAEEGA